MDKYDDVKDDDNAYKYDDEVFWWSVYLQDGHDNGDAPANRTNADNKNEVANNGRDEYDDANDSNDAYKYDDEVF